MQFTSATLCTIVSFAVLAFDLHHHKDTKAHKERHGIHTSTSDDARTGVDSPRLH